MMMVQRDGGPGWVEPQSTRTRPVLHDDGLVQAALARHGRRYEAAHYARLGIPRSNLSARARCCSFLARAERTVSITPPPPARRRQTLLCGDSALLGRESWSRAGPKWSAAERWLISVHHWAPPTDMTTRSAGGDYRLSMAGLSARRPGRRVYGRGPWHPPIRLRGLGRVGSTTITAGTKKQRRGRLENLGKGGWPGCMGALREEKGPHRRRMMMVFAKGGPGCRALSGWLRCQRRRRGGTLLSRLARIFATDGWFAAGGAAAAAAPAPAAPACLAPSRGRLRHSHHHDRQTRVSAGTVETQPQQTSGPRANRTRSPSPSPSPSCTPTPRPRSPVRPPLRAEGERLRVWRV